MLYLENSLSRGHKVSQFLLPLERLHRSGLAGGLETDDDTFVHLDHLA